MPSDAPNGFRAVFKEVLNLERNPFKKNKLTGGRSRNFEKTGKGCQLYCKKIRRVTEFSLKWSPFTFETDYEITSVEPHKILRLEANI